MLCSLDPTSSPDWSWYVYFQIKPLLNQQFAIENGHFDIVDVADDLSSCGQNLDEAYNVPSPSFSQLPNIFFEPHEYYAYQVKKKIHSRNTSSTISYGFFFGKSQDHQPWLNGLLPMTDPYVCHIYIYGLPFISKNPSHVSINLPTIHTWIRHGLGKSIDSRWRFSHHRPLHQADPADPADPAARAASWEGRPTAWASMPRGRRRRGP